MPILGDLEQSVMDVLWSRSVPTSVRDVHEELLRGREIAYTTVMTVLDRLAKKKVVSRELDGRAWLYRPSRTRVELHTDGVLDALSGLSGEERAQVLDAVRSSAASVA